MELIPPSSFKALQSALSFNTTLQKLHIRDCTFSNTYMEMIVKGMGLNPAKNIRKLAFHNTQMQPSCLKPLCSYLRYVDPASFEELDLSNIDVGECITDLC